MKKKLLVVFGLAASLSLLTQADLVLGLTSDANTNSAGSVWVFDFSVDAAGNVTVTNGTGDTFFSTVSGAGATVVGTVDSSLAGVTFSLKMTTSGNSFGMHSAGDGSFGVNGEGAAGNHFRLNGAEIIYFDWDLTGLPSNYNFQMNALGLQYVPAGGGGNFSINGVTNTAATDFVQNQTGAFVLDTSVFAGGSDPAAIAIGVTGTGDVRLGSINFTITPVPEPSTISLFLISSTMLFIARAARSGFQK